MQSKGVLTLTDSTREQVGQYKIGQSRFQFAHSVDPILKQGDAGFDRR